MIELIIPSIELKEAIASGINVIKIEDSRLLRDLYFNIEDKIFLFKNGEEVKKDIIKNILEVDINEKKNVGNLHKEIIRCIKRNNDNKFYKILSLLKDLIYEVQVDLNNSEIEIAQKIDEEKI